jgi:signal transduction histidine kinase
VTRKFVRGRQAASGGSGLGLAIAQSIVEAHGGTISLKATGAPGADFCIMLPLDKPGVGGTDVEGQGVEIDSTQNP